MDAPLVLCGIGTLLVRLGYTLLLAGSTRSKNTGSSIFRLILDLALVSLLFYFGGTFLAPELSKSREFFLLAAVLTGTCAPISSASERIKLFPAFIPSILLSAILFPLFYRWTQTGFLSNGFKDYGLAACIHLPAGLSALLITLFVGPRSGKYNKDGSSNAIPGNSLPITSAGLILTFISWFFYLLGFNGFADDVALNLLLGVSAGILASSLFSQVRYSKPDIHVILTGLMGSMIAITPIANTTHTWVCVLVGLIAGIAVPFLLLTLDLIFKIDDVTGSGVIHGAGALIGLLAAPWVRFSFKSILIQYLGLTIIAVITLVVVGAALYYVNKVFGLRSKEADEFDGLDLAEHDINSWPDFQQTMIKSYHLREA